MEPAPLRVTLGEVFRRRGIDLNDIPADPDPEPGPAPEPAPAGGPTTPTVPAALDHTDRHIPARYAGAVATHPDLVTWVHTLRDRALPSGQVARTGPSVLVMGPTGVGKTHQGYGAIRLLASYGVWANWVALTAADLYARLRPRHGVDSEAEFETVADAPILMLDDLGAAKPSEWIEEVNYRLINRRYEHILPTVFTSNVPPRDLGGVLGERVASRLTEMTARVVLQGADQRRRSS